MNTTKKSTEKQNSILDSISSRYKKSVKSISSIRAVRWLIVVISLIFLLFIILGISHIVTFGAESGGQIYKAIGFGMIMVWVCIFICYFIWAVYFYNLNYGYSQAVWDKIEEAKKNRSDGKEYCQAYIDDEPKVNPYKDETFGLPNGTVRGMIAFTLLFGSIAMLVVSFGMKNEIQSSGFFIDQFDFFKKAFLMMIAFYFGNHSLKYLKPAEPKKLDETAPTEKPTIYPPKTPEIVLIQPDSNKTPSDDEEMPPITAIDPMETKG